MVPTRTADRLDAPGHVSAPLRHKVTEDGQDRGVGARAELHGGGSEASHTLAGALQPHEEPGGRPAPLSEVAGRQGKVERHVVEDLGEVAPLVQILDLPVPHMVDNVLDDALRIPERPMALQVIEVPKILIDVIPARSLVPQPQTAEQFVEVPTVVSYAHRFADRRADRRHSSSSGSWQAIYFGSVLFSPFNMCASFLNVLFLCHWIAASGQGAYSGMVGCLVLEVLFMMIPGLSLLVI